MSHMIRTTWRRCLVVSAAAIVATVALSSPARGQDVISKEAAAALKAAFLADLEVMRGKYVGLAEAFPPDKYSYKPMDGVRSTAEVLMLAAMEGYTFIPNSFGGKPAELGTREQMQALRTLSDKPKVIEHLNLGFAHAKAQLEAIDPATLTGRRQVMGRQMSALETALAVGGDLHEHLGQLIAYARANRVVPPWSK